MKLRSLVLCTGLLWAVPTVAQEAPSNRVAEAQTLDLNHIGFAVTKLDATASFFIDDIWEHIP